MVSGKEHRRHSRKVTSTKRWRFLRQQALDRDEWQCLSCGTSQRLEVDHIKPVRTNPELAFSLSNLQTLCGRCHARKTAQETGITPLSPRRRAWRQLVNETHQKSKLEKV